MSVKSPWQSQELLRWQMVSYSNFWSKTFTKWLWHDWQHWDSGQATCTMTGSVCTEQAELRCEREAIPLKSEGREREGRVGGGGTDGRIKTPHPQLLLSSHLSSCGCPSDAVKWVKPSTSASAPREPGIGHSPAEPPPRRTAKRAASGWGHKKLMVLSV